MREKVSGEAVSKLWVRCNKCHERISMYSYPRTGCVWCQYIPTDADPIIRVPLTRWEKP